MESILAICKTCGKDRELVKVTPYYGVLANAGQHTVEVCKVCAAKLTDNSVKKYTDLLQTEIWDKKVEDPIDAVIRPMRRINYMIRFAPEVNTNPESLSEHSYQVLMLSLQIAKRFDLDVDFEKLVSYGAFHDLGEILSGDVPSPLKNKDIKKESDQLEETAIDIFKNQWGLWLGDIENYNPDNIDDIESRIVKCADCLSAIVFAMEEAFIGSKNMEEVCQRALRAFHKYAYHEWEKALLWQITSLVLETL